MNIFKNILQEMRVKHYIKNILVFLPLVFSLNLFDSALFLLAFLVFLAFCLGSSGVYVVNDIADLEKDRLHPVKKNRPIAAGRLGIKTGGVLAACCFAASLALAALAGFLAADGWRVFLVLLAYLVINMLYSFILKHIPLADVFCLMTGFLLRVACGALAIGVPLSGWLMLTIMALSLFMAFGKRRGELRSSPENFGTRRVLGAYTEAFLDRAAYSMMTLSAAFYALWAIDAGTAEHLGTENLIWTTPLVIAGLLRYAQLLEKDKEAGDPANVFFADKPLLLILPAYGLMVLVIVYFW